MQVYTKILLGMAVGVVVGLTLGPRSPLLEHDIYKVEQWQRLQLRQERAAPETAISLPESPPSKSAPLRLQIAEVQTERVGEPGERQTVPQWAQVRLRYGGQLALRDKGDSLRAQLGSPEPGERVTLWLKIEQRSLSDGRVTTWPQPVSSVGDTVIAWLEPVGSLFLRLIKMVIVPLVFSSLLVGVASLGDIRKLGRLGAKTIGLYLATTAAAVTLGLLCAHAVDPGSFVDEASRVALQAQFDAAAGDTVRRASEAPSLVDNLLGIVPTNPIAALVSGNMLQIIFFAIIFGVALTMLGDAQGQPVVTFFDRVQHAMVLVIHIVMLVAPFGVAALLAKVVGTSGFSVLKGLVVYGAVVLLGLALHGGLVYGAIAKLLARLPLGDFLRAARPAQLIAFSTSSSSAALPVTMETAEESLNVSNSVSSFVLPLGSTINMDGTALYQGVAAVFIAQVFQMDLSLGAQLGVVLTATMASIGAAGVPGAGMVTLAMVLTTAGIPTVGVALILGMDRILDMFRTALNVTGDLAVTSALAVGEGERVRYLTGAQDSADPSRGFEHRLESEPHPVRPRNEER